MKEDVTVWNPAIGSVISGLSVERNDHHKRNFLITIETDKGSIEIDVRLDEAIDIRFGSPTLSELIGSGPKDGETWQCIKAANGESP